MDFLKTHLRRRLRAQGPVRPDAGDRRKHRQRGFGRRKGRERSLPAKDRELRAAFRPGARRKRGRTRPHPSRPAALFGRSTSPAIRSPTRTGEVKLPNVNTLIETVDMREAQRSYEANLNLVTATRRMISRTLDILRDLGAIPMATTSFAAGAYAASPEPERSGAASPARLRPAEAISRPSSRMRSKASRSPARQPRRRPSRSRTARPTSSTSSPPSPKARPPSKRSSRCATG